ncbi:MAG: phospho-sugar mutase [Clostridia bacterium]|nr:phospho-sugar mutase [Clostridia bacterium]
MEQYIQRYIDWLTSDYIDEGTRAELRSIKDDENEIKTRFLSYMEFGTGGLRSKMCAGCGMMNIYTVAHATAAAAMAVLESFPDARERGVIIGYDCRNNSAAFARRCAEVMTSYGIKVYLFDELRPTPMLSFGVRHFGCAAGINITASHNPAAYNGYKFYWEDGAQPTSQTADKVAAHMHTMDIFSVPGPDKADESLITMVGRDFDELFIKNVMAEGVYPDIIKKAADSLKVVYTPLFGCGYRIVPDVLGRAGVTHLFTVDSQMTPNGDFPGLPKPNPEYPAAFGESIKVAEKVGSDIIIANDPDADRIGVMARDRSGEFKCITGNQMGSLLLDYIFTALEEKGKMPEKPFAVKTIVTSEMATAICRKHNVELDNCLTGFKNIAEAVAKHESTDNASFLLGYEESYGYMKGSYARDKDGVVAAMLICEMAAYYSLRGMTLIDAMGELYEKYGCYTEYSAEIYMEGLDGKDKIAAMMEKLRNMVPETLAGSRVVNVRDYLAQTSRNILTGEVTGTGLASSNVMYYLAENGCVVVARPSGTEPKIKFYILANGKDLDSASANARSCTNTLEDMLGLPHDSLKK